MQRPNVQWITVFGLGHMWPASGTWGSLPPVVVAGAVLAFGYAFDIEWCPTCNDGPPWYASAWGWVYYAALVLILMVFSLACVMQGDGAEVRFRKKDPSQAVADETAGQCIPLLVLPLFWDSMRESPWRVGAALLTAFIAFRLMDIIKPWPARGLQRLVGGWGVLVDDLFAGLYAAIITWAVLHWLM